MKSLYDQLMDLSVKHLYTCHMLSPILPASLIGLTVGILILDYGKWILSKVTKFKCICLLTHSFIFPYID